MMKYLMCLLLHFAITATGFTISSSCPTKKNALWMRKIIGMVTEEPEKKSVWTAIKSSTIKDNFLEFSTRHTLFTSDTRIQSLYIRSDYVEVFKLIKNHVNEVRLMDAEDIIHIVVTGTPGIGKSLFAYYFLWKSLQDETFENKKLYFQSAPDCIFYLPKDGEMIELSVDDKRKARGDPETVLLVDMDELKGPAKWGGITIILASPNEARFKEFLKHGNPENFFMNPWSYEDIIKVWEKEYQNNKVSLEDVDKIFYMYGGVIRFVLEQNKKASSSMNKVFDKIKSFKDLAKCISKKSVEDSLITYKIVHYISDDHSSPTAKLYLASAYVANKLLENIEVENLDE
eukprot:gene17743-24731_t